MTVWEYKIVTEKVQFAFKGFGPEFGADSLASFQKLGQEGWELVSGIPVSSNLIMGNTSNVVRVFKRPKP